MNARTRTSSWAVPSIAVVAALAAVLIATVWLFASSDPEPGQTTVADSGATTPASPAPTTAAASEPAPEPTQAPAKKAKEPEVPRAYVEVYNNSQVSGLADRTASRAERSGWTVVGIDNWYGSIPETTVYYPSELKDQARLLAEDLGVDRVRAAVDPMKLDRLTVILVG
ncbi:UNVERIFIED_CONTAM: hypothetical protein LK11_04685 [Mumia flava]